MSWSYSGDPNSSIKDAVRFLIGDTVSADPQLSDEEINYEITQEGNVFGAAIACAQALAAKFARLVDKSVDSFRISYSQRAQHYKDLADTLKERTAMKDGVPYMGGQTLSDKQIDAQNPDMIHPSFFRGQFDFPLNRNPNNLPPEQSSDFSNQ